MNRRVIGSAESEMLKDALADAIIKHAITPMFREGIKQILAETQKNKPPFWAPDWRKGKRK